MKSLTPRYKNWLEINGMGGGPTTASYISQVRPKPDELHI
jgi:hypothetical protein